MPLYLLMFDNDGDRFFEVHDDFENLKTSVRAMIDAYYADTDVPWREKDKMHAEAQLALKNERFGIVLLDEDRQIVWQVDGYCDFYSFVRPPKVAVTVEGGVITNITASREMDVVLIDYDTQGCDEHTTKWVPQVNSGTGAVEGYESADVRYYGIVDATPERAEQLYGLINAPSVADDSRTKTARKKD